VKFVRATRTVVDQMTEHLCGRGYMRGPVAAYELIGLDRIGDWALEIFMNSRVAV